MTAEATEAQVAAAMEALDGHDLLSSGRCYCGEWEVGVGPFDAVRQHERHKSRAVADAVVAAGPDPVTIAALESAIDRVRRRHPRGDEETGRLAPGLWCPTCGVERAANGYGGCPDRNALTEPRP